MKYFFLLLFSFLCFGDLSAQVGINNPNPSQALDIGGKIKVGDDQIPPVAGTIRYNRVARTFEGFDGTEWSVFNPEVDDDGGGGGNTPASGDQVRGSISTGGFPTDGITESLSWWYGTGSLNYYLEVPANRTVRITSILISPRRLSPEYSILLTPKTQDGYSIPAAKMEFFSGPGDSPFYVNDPTSQILVIPGGGALEVEWENFSGRISFIGYIE